ncbi:bacteriophytochrome (light-regulated signal transduction histidine kinase) [Rivularia sp. PCC 7116]|uniref:ATP-binding protein n=1 Tax=Rivularia sp. PCC 7116 TaxID=373994 RepID=UPI00029F034F|nr:ATP-binding protein [Rivularia sp. PCC 7116]AFY56715.1 bacteriophytochrome (light-regulated signal transduction histidine kinase) [Rivularia sp. PCC 7116]
MSLGNAESTNQVVTAQNVNLTNCDREAIQIPSSIQPYGILLALREPEFTIVQVSNNTFEYLGLQPEELLNQKLSFLIDESQIQAIRMCLREDFESINPLKVSIKPADKTLVFDGIVHRSVGVVILELEPTQSTPDDAKFFDFYNLVRTPLGKIQKSSTLSELCDVIVKEVRKITGFDRVMIYRFDDDGAGMVIAESPREDLEKFLGLRYPATDIPKQARALYELNLLRLIRNVNYQPVSLIPQLNPQTNEPLDMSLSVLRSVSPLHVEYLHNMGVSVSMSVSLLKDKKLWGLIACHHYGSEKSLSYEIRTVCEFLGQIISFELAAKEENEDLDYKIKLKSIQSRFIDSITQAEDLIDGLTKNPSDLLDLVSASGVAIFNVGSLITEGTIPTELQISELVSWVETQMGNEIIYHTDFLASVYPEAEKFTDVGSGLIALAISKIQKTYILWFRPEVVQTVNWGGNPHKPVEVLEDGTVNISPRQSFKLWQETVKQKSLAWKNCEIEAALELRSSIVGILLRKAEQLAKVNLELERSNDDLDSFAYIASHDLKEPLRGIHNYSSFLMEDYGETLDSDGVTKLETLMRLTKRMENLIDSLLHYSRLGKSELSLHNTDLNEIVNNAVDVIRISQNKEFDIQIPKQLPTINCDATQISELFSNLISNGLKYNDKAEKCVEIGFIDPIADIEAYQLLYTHLSDSQLPVIFYVKDNGIGIRSKHLETIFRIFKRLHAPSRYGGGTGAGLTIVKKIVERHNGTIWLESTFKEGSTFYFTLQPDRE